MKTDQIRAEPGLGASSRARAAAGGPPMPANKGNSYRTTYMLMSLPPLVLPPCCPPRNLGSKIQVSVS